MNEHTAFVDTVVYRTYLARYHLLSTLTLWYDHPIRLAQRLPRQLTEHQLAGLQPQASICDVTSHIRHSGMLRVATYEKLLLVFSSIVYFGKLSLCSR